MTSDQPSPRSKYNVNSPKAKNQNFSWGQQGDDDSPGAIPSYLVTQVNQGDEKKNIQFEEKANKQDEDEIVDVEGKPPGCCRCSCWASLFGGGSKKRSVQDSDARGDEVRTSEVPLGSLPKEDSESESSIDEKGLLGPRRKEAKGKKCLVLDLDETLVHSCFTEQECSFSVPIYLEGQEHQVYVKKRPFADEFLLECSKYYEIVVFTASLAAYANPVIDKLDIHKVIHHRLFRESCVLHNGAYVKDLSILGRKINKTIIIDNSPLSYLFHPRNAIGCTSWFEDPRDTELNDLLPFLRTKLKEVKDVRDILNAATQSYQYVCGMGNEEDARPKENADSRPVK